MNHLEPLPRPPSDGEDEELRPLQRPPWWRWVAALLVLALVVATPFAYALYLLLR